MDERTAHEIVAEMVGAAGDDAAAICGHVLTTDMLHETTDFPHGTTRYTAGWRSVGASLSDIAAMGASAVAVVAVYAAPQLIETELREFIRGATDVCRRVDATYVGGDLDVHDEFTVVTTALGRTTGPIRRNGATPGEVVCVTGTLGRSAAAVRLFDRGDVERANDLFRFDPRIPAGIEIARSATAMMDSSDGIARSLHQLARASGCGFSIDGDRLPIDDAIDAVARNTDDRRELGIFFGEDFELVFVVPQRAVSKLHAASPTDISIIGEVTDAGVVIDDNPLPDRGYTHSDR